MLQVDIEHDEASAEEAADPHPPGSFRARLPRLAVAEETEESEGHRPDQEVHHGGLDRGVKERAELSVDGGLHGTEGAEGHAEEAGPPKFCLRTGGVRLLFRTAAEGDDDDAGEDEGGAEDAPDGEGNYIAPEPAEGVDEDAHDDLPEEREHDGLGGAENGKQYEVSGEDRDAAETAEEHPDGLAGEFSKRDESIAQEKREDDQEAEADEEVDAGSPEGRAQRAAQARVDARLQRHDETG